MLSKIKKDMKGITLIALVITIIVLLILAGVSIAMLTGQNGILSQANTAKTQTEIADAKEQAKLDIVAWQSDKMEKGKDSTLSDSIIKGILTGKDYVKEAKDTSFITAKGDHEIPYSDLYTKTDTGTGKVQPGVIVEKTEKNNYSDGADTATVPAGFTVSGISEEQKISTGLVIYDIPKGTEVDWKSDIDNIRATYNQFVWIPVEEGEYERDLTYPSYYDEPLETTPEGTISDTGYLPEGIKPETDSAENSETAERNAVIKYNGFYIGRYEAGEEGGNVVSKQNATVYVEETQTEFKRIAKTMYDNTNQNVRSAMCSGIQWDMVMHFVDGKNDAKGNLFDVRVYDENRHNGTDVTKSGLNDYDKVQNIYDLESNCLEYVAEKINTSDVYRGGVYSKNSDERASIRRSNFYYLSGNVTFRPTLYIL